jgi:hypothetical protein
MFSLFLFWIGSAFGATPEYIKANAVEFHGVDVPQTLVEAFDQKKLVLIGEDHGITELPEYALQIVKAQAAKRPVALGLEFPKSVEADIKKFIHSNDPAILRKLSFFKDANSHSGRGSEAMVKMLRELGSIPGLDVFCFDVELSDYNTERDTKMALNILSYLALHPDRQLLTYSGNLHSRLTTGHMGYEVLRLAGGVLNSKNVSNLVIQPGGGSAWWCLMEKGKPVCGPRVIAPSQSAYATAVSFERYFLKEPELTDGHANLVFIRSVTQSTPFLDSAAER